MSKEHSNMATTEGLPHSIRDITDEHAMALSSLSIEHTYLISGAMLLSCCILPLLYFWFCHSMTRKYLGIIRTSKRNKVALEETQVDEAELTEFVPDEAPDRVDIRCDPIFDDVKVKVFHRRHHLLRSQHRRPKKQHQNVNKISSSNEVSEQGIEPNEETGNIPEERVSSGANGAAEQLTSTEITFSPQMQQTL